MRIYGFGFDQIRQLRLPVPETTPFVTTKLNLGMISMLDLLNIPNEALKSITNGVVLFDRVTKRNGSTRLYTGVVGGDNLIKKISSMKLPDETIRTMVFASGAIKEFVGGAMVAFPATPALTDLSIDRITIAQLLDNFVFANNGADPLQLIDYTGNTIAPLGNAPNYKYVTSLANRIVGANRRGVNGIELGWSAEYPDIDEWSSIVLNTAGTTPVTDGTDDFSNHITGLFTMLNIGILLREKSIWHMTKQAIPTEPFYNYEAFPGVGCDLPYSAVLGEGGLCFADKHSGSVFFYSPGKAPERIGRYVEKDILSMINEGNKDKIFAGYVNASNDYRLCIPLQSSSKVVIWNYSFITQAWSKHEMEFITSIDETIVGIGGVTMDQLGSTPFDSLTGTMDELGGDSQQQNGVLFGIVGGKISYEDEGVITDYRGATGDVGYETTLISKGYALPHWAVIVSSIQIEYIVVVPGAIRLDFSKDGKDWITLKTKVESQVGRVGQLLHDEPISCRRFQWRVVQLEDGKFDIPGYSIYTDKTEAKV